MRWLVGYHQLNGHAFECFSCGVGTWTGKPGLVGRPWARKESDLTGD